MVTMNVKTITRKPCASWAYNSSNNREYCDLYASGLDDSATHGRTPHSEDGIDQKEYQHRLVAWRNAQV